MSNNITLASFANGNVFPTDVTKQILHTGLSAAPIFSAMTPRITNRSKVSFPTGSPDGFDWTPELGTIPTVDPHDGAEIVTMAKLAGLLPLSNESVADTDLNLTDELGRLIADSMAPKADKDLTYGPTPANAAGPAGFFSGLTKVTKTTLRAAVVDAAAAIMTAGGNPTTVLLSPALWAAEVNRRETTTASSGMLDDLGISLQVIVAATLKATDALVIDKTGCFALTRSGYTIEANSLSGDAWTKDAISLRVKAHLEVAIPAPAKHARSIAVDDGA